MLKEHFPQLQLVFHGRARLDNQPDKSPGTCLTRSESVYSDNPGSQWRFGLLGRPRETILLHVPAKDVCSRRLISELFLKKNR